MSLHALRLRGVRDWANRNVSIKELWLLGNPAEIVNARDDETEMIAILSPPAEGVDWAFFNFVNQQDLWSHELSAVIGAHVKLEAMRPGPKCEAFVRASGVLLSARY